MFVQCWEWVRKDRFTAPSHLKKKKVLYRKGWMQEKSCLASLLCPASAVPHPAHTWRRAAPAPGIIHVASRVLRREICACGKLAPWITPLRLSSLAGAHRDFFFPLADGKYSSVEPQYLTDKTITFPLSVSGSQVNRLCWHHRGCTGAGSWPRQRASKHSTTISHTSS